MKVTELNPFTVMELFPSYRETIKNLFRIDAGFQTLCSDYHRCSKAMQFWNKSDLCEAQQRKVEYQALLQELESEILQYLEKASNVNVNNKKTGE